MRRSKAELEYMERTCKTWLEDVNWNYHKAWDEYIKFHLINNIKLPNYINGIKDFKKTCEKYKNWYENKIVQENTIKENKTIEKDYQDIIRELTKEKDYQKIKELYNKYKGQNTENKNHLVNLMMMINDISSGGNKEDWKFTASEIRAYKDLGII